jgi:hypothetical protein
MGRYRFYMVIADGESRVRTAAQRPMGRRMSAAELISHQRQSEEGSAVSTCA